MKIKKNVFALAMLVAAMLVIPMVSVLTLPVSAAYNPISEEDKDLSNLEKARVILEHFQKSGVDSAWAYDIEKNKEVVEVMLMACVEMTDEEISQLTSEEQLSFYAYFQKLYEVSGLDAAELGELFELKDLEKAVDEIYHVEDKRTDTEIQSSKENQNGMDKTQNSIFIVVAIIVAITLLSIALSRSIQKNNNKKTP